VEPGAAGYRVRARVRLALECGGRALRVGEGNTLCRDTRAPPAGGAGPVRALPRIVDYHYARHDSDARYVLDPFIHRGLWRDVQVWVPPFSPPAPGDAVPERQPLAVVVKTCPLASLNQSSTQPPTVSKWWTKYTIPAGSQCEQRILRVVVQTSSIASCPVAASPRPAPPGLYVDRAAGESTAASASPPVARATSLVRAASAAGGRWRADLDPRRRWP